jgi:hypothetical protein
MFNLDQAIAEWRRQMLAAGIKTPGALQELETHLRDDVEHQILFGVSAEPAFDIAVQQLGSAHTLKAEFAKTAGRKQRHYAYRGLGFGIGLFAAGVSFCYFVLLPIALMASRKYSEWLGIGADQWTAEQYISFVCNFMLGMGLGFEMPVILLVLVKIGILDYPKLAAFRRYMIVINLVLGAVLTTPEVLTQIMMAIPLQILYEITVWIAWYWERQEKQCSTAA